QKLAAEAAPTRFSRGFKSSRLPPLLRVLLLLPAAFCQGESASLRWVARSCWRTRWNSLATSATATAGRSSDCWRAPISMRLAAADSDIAPRLALEDFSECAASRRAA